MASLGAVSSRPPLATVRQDEGIENGGSEWYRRSRDVGGSMNPHSGRQGSSNRRLSPERRRVNPPTDGSVGDAGGRRPNSGVGTNESLVPTEWAFPSSEVKIEQGEDGVLGRGSYGEVRVATWRGLRVAAKQLHALSGAQATNLSAEQAADVRRDLLKEMRLLATLRHPNLLLFLGVTYDTQLDNPQSIITELMPSSVYDILETKGVRLEQAEVVDFASDITSGLAYLHEHSPVVVHRDLSSRNVLYDGRRAKLADLGQAKAMGATAAAVAGNGSRQTAMPGAMVYAAPEVLTGRYSSSIDMFSFGVLLAQLITGEYPRLERRKEQVEAAEGRSPSLRPLLDRCLSLHAEDRPGASEAARALEDLKADPCAYRPAGHDAGVLADRWFQTKQKERCRGLEARLLVHERRLSAEIGRWQEEADRADAMAEKIGAAESDRDGAVKRMGELEENMAGAIAALEDERTSHSATREDLEQAKAEGRSLERDAEHLKEELRRAQRAVKSAETLQGLAEGNCSLANRAATESAEARAKAEQRAAQAEAQLAGQVAATREAEVRLGQAISRWEGEKVDRLKFKKEYMAKCSEAQDRERTVRDLRTSLKEADARLSKYDGLPESQQIRQRVLDLEEDCKRAGKETVEREEQLKERRKDIEALTDQIRAVEKEANISREQNEALRGDVDSANRARKDDLKRLEKAERALQKARKQAEEGDEMNFRLKEENLNVREEVKRVKKDAPWLFKGRGRKKGPPVPDVTGGDSDALRGGSGVVGIDGTDKTAATPPSALGDSVGHRRGNSADAASRPSADFDRGTGCSRRPTSSTNSSGSSSGSSSGDGDRSNSSEALVDEAKNAGPREVTELLRRHPKRHELQCRGLRALRDLAYNGEEQRAAVAAAGGVAAAVRAMNRFPGDCRLQVGGTKTLAHLAFGNDANRIEVGSCGGVTAIIRAMAAFPSNGELQGEACTAVTNLSHNCDRNRRLVVGEGGLVLILNTMQAFPGDSKLQRQACWALLTLAANDEISRMIASEGGVGAIIAAMINNPDDTSVQHFGCWALANVGWGQAAVQKFAREEGALEAIQTAIHRFPGHHALVAKGRLALDVILKGAGLTPLL